MIEKMVTMEIDFGQLAFSNPDERMMDMFTKRVLYTAEYLFRADFSQLDRDNTGVVLSTRFGVYRSLQHMAEVVKENGYKGINPSRFPNVMLSTALARLAIRCNVHGPSCVFYAGDDNDNSAIEYCELQLQLGNSEAMILICVDETGPTKGVYMRGKI